MNLPRNRPRPGIVIAVATALGLSFPDNLHGSDGGIVTESRGQVTHSVERRPVRPGVCDREAAALLHRKPVRIRGSIRAPKKIRDIRPKYPDLPPGTTGSGMWIGEALIDTSGKVARVWPIREVEFTPPFPTFNRAITDAIRQWEFEPVILHGKAAPVCMTVTVTIDWS